MRPLRLVVGLALALGAAGADVPDTYQIISQRNLFSPSRVGTLPRQATAAVEAPPPAETITLAGVAVLEGQATALFAGSTPSLSGPRQPGDTLDNLRVGTVSTAGVSFATGSLEGSLRLAVGQSLRRLQGQPWQLSAETPPIAAAPAPLAAPQTATPAGDAGDILKRLLERRQKEMNP